MNNAAALSSVTSVNQMPKMKVICSTSSDRVWLRN